MAAVCQGGPTVSPSAPHVGIRFITVQGTVQGTKGKGGRGGGGETTDNTMSTNFGTSACKPYEETSLKFDRIRQVVKQ